MKYLLDINTECIFFKEHYTNQSIFCLDHTFLAQAHTTLMIMDISQYLKYFTSDSGK